MSVTYITEGDSATPAYMNTLLNAVAGETYNVKSFGAVGDGTTDDTTVIQETLDAAYAARGNSASPVTVVFPTGVYGITSLTVPASLQLLGRGGRITKLGSSTSPLLHVADPGGGEYVHDIRWDRMRIEGNLSVVHDGVYIEGPSALITDLNNTIIHRCGGANLRIKGADVAFINNLWSFNGDLYGVQSGGGQRAIYLENIVGDVYLNNVALEGSPSVAGLDIQTGGTNVFVNNSRSWFIDVNVPVISSTDVLGLYIRNFSTSWTNNTGSPITVADVFRFAGSWYGSVENYTRQATGSFTFTADITDAGYSLDASGKIGLYDSQRGRSVTRLAETKLERLACEHFFLDDAVTIVVDAADGNSCQVQLTADRAMGAPTNPRAGQMLTFRVMQDTTGGWDLTWNAVFLHAWSDTGNTASKSSTITFLCVSESPQLWVQVGAQSPYISF